MKANNCAWVCRDLKPRLNEASELHINFQRYRTVHTTAAFVCEPVPEVNFAKHRELTYLREYSAIDSFRYIKIQLGSEA